MYTIKGHQRSDNSGSLGLARCSEREYEYASVDLEYPLVSSCSFAIDVLGWKLYNVCAIQFYDPTRDVCFWKNWGSLQCYILLQLYHFCAWIGDTIGSHSLEKSMRLSTCQTGWYIDSLCLPSMQLSYVDDI